ncbi:hypothetical protein L209DRAFT_751502 [Thermothelomyces heterothallicus CBS 203.75]
MGSRKRAKPNPAADSGTPTSTPTRPPSAMPSQPSSASSRSGAAITEQRTPPVSEAVSDGRDRTLAKQGSNQVHNTRSWYGSWPRVSKSVASTQVARETILGGTSKPAGTANLSRFEQKKGADSVSVSDGPQSGPATPKTQDDAASAGKCPSEPASLAAGNVVKPEEDKTKPGDAGTESDTKLLDAGGEEETTRLPAEQSASVGTEEQPAAASTPQRPSSGWFGWFARTTTAEPVSSANAPVPAGTTSQEANVPIPVEAEQSRPPQDSQTDEASNPPEEAQEAAGNHHQPPTQDKKATGYGSSWLWYWSSRTAPAPSQPEPEPGPPPAEPEATSATVKEPEDVVMQDAPAAEAAPEQPTPPPKAGSTWAFWSRDSGSISTKKPARRQGEQGQLAVMGERSETLPRRANSMEFESTKSTPAEEPSLKPKQKKEREEAAATPSREPSSKSSNKRVRLKSMEVDGALPSRPSTPQAGTTTKPSAAKTPAAAKVSPPNLLLPSFEGTYKLKDNPSIIKQIAQLLLRTRQPSGKHVYRTKEPAKIKSAIAIGVHGLFPATYLRPMIGQPTGTSIKFANHCAEAIRRWANSHGCADCEIEKVALEGEGKIGERVENLWKLLLNWIDLIRKADLILIACHSQGVPVSIMLLAKLIELGVVGSARIGVCAMAGVSLGPFPDYRTGMGILMGSAAELWEFADPQSEVSKRLEASLKVVLNHGARLTYIGSIDDQLVPLESAIYAPAHHPYIYRAVFIDGRIHAPDFIAHLVGFALKLRNLGVSDHGLIRELSTPLAGSLYSGEGHSRLYDEEQVYDLAVTHALETTNLEGPCEVVHTRRSGAGGDGGVGQPNPNPYHLPWIMRGLLEEDFVKTELSAETAELVRQFDDWKPVTKALKDVKYRLEAVRSKL